MNIQGHYLSHNGVLLPVVGNIVDYSVNVYSDHGTLGAKQLKSEDFKRTLAIRFTAVPVIDGGRELVFSYCDCSCFYSVCNNTMVDNKIMQPKWTKDRELGLLNVDAGSDARSVVSRFSDRLINVTGSEDLQP